jgi:hypothetical protein
MSVMELQITAGMLQHLSKQIASGKVIWSLLTLNEYTSKTTDPLIVCLRLKAKKALNTLMHLYPEDFVEKILQGKKFSEFPEYEREQIKNIKENFTKKKTFSFAKAGSDWRARRRANHNFDSNPSKRWSSLSRS